MKRIVYKNGMQTEQPTLQLPIIEVKERGDEIMNHTPQDGPASGGGPQSAAGKDHRSLLPSSTTGERKIEHVRLCLNEEVGANGVTTGFEEYRFRHNALPELDFADISLNTVFLERSLRTPLLISSMTGGSTATRSEERRVGKECPV